MCFVTKEAAGGTGCGVRQLSTEAVDNLVEKLS